MELKGKRNIVLAGVARSGSTLTCYLLNKLANTVALHEPIFDPGVLEHYALSDKLQFISQFFERQRHSLLTDGVAASKSAGGKVPDNPRGDFDPLTRKRKRVLDGTQLVVDKVLDEDLNLIIKQPGLFSGMLSELVDHYPCYATIRNPLSVLLSWNTVNMQVSLGRAPAAELCDPSLKSSLDSESDRYRRQLMLLSWYFAQYRDNLPDENIIRYEKVIESNGGVLSVMVPEARGLNFPLQSKNNNPIYNQELKDRLLRLLLNSRGAYWDFYSPKDLVDLA